MLERKQLKKPNFLERLFNSTMQGNALIEINNLLYEKDGQLVRVEELISILEKYKINLYQWDKRSKKELFELFYLYNLYDKRFSDEESSEIRTLRRIVSLDEDTILGIKAKVIAEVYDRTLDEVLSDQSISDQERTYLEDVRCNLNIPKNIAEKLYSESALKLLEGVTSKMISDERFDSNEEETAINLAKYLGVSLQDISSVRELNKYKLFWKIENGQLPIINTDLLLTSGENCHHWEEVEWCEYVNVTKKIYHSDYSNQAQMAESNYQPEEQFELQTEEVLKSFGKGNVYITNKRLIYEDQSGYESIELSNIINFKIYTDGIEISEANYNDVFLAFSSNIDMFAIILKKVISNIVI